MDKFQISIYTFSMINKLKQINAALYHSLFWHKRYYMQYCVLLYESDVAMTSQGIVFKILNTL